MGSAILTFEDGAIWLNSFRLPGVLKNLAVNAKIQFDDAKVDAQSGKNQTSMGWECAGVDAVIELLSDVEFNCYDYLGLVTDTFHAEDEHGAPQEYLLINPHTLSRNILDVFFAGLDTRETDQDDVIEATLHFTEITPLSLRRGGLSGALSLEKPPPLDATVSGDAL